MQAFVPEYNARRKSMENAIIFIVCNAGKEIYHEENV